MSILIPTIPERRAFLERAVRSVKRQIDNRWECLIETDWQHRGCALTVNTLSNRASGEWLLILADDDYLRPDCLLGLRACSGEADVVYSRPVVLGRDADGYHGEPPAIPSLALIRKTLWVELGGYDLLLRHMEDRDLWTRALAAGARFVRADDYLWSYIFHGDNKSLRRQHQDDDRVA